MFVNGWKQKATGLKYTWIYLLLNKLQLIVVNISQIRFMVLEPNKTSHNYHRYFATN